MLLTLQTRPHCIVIIVPERDTVRWTCFLRVLCFFVFYNCAKRFEVFKVETTLLCVKCETISIWKRLHPLCLCLIPTWNRNNSLIVSILWRTGTQGKMSSSWEESKRESGKRWIKCGTCLERENACWVLYTTKEKESHQVDCTRHKTLKINW